MHDRRPSASRDPTSRRMRAGRHPHTLTGWQQSLRSSMARLRMPGRLLVLPPPRSAPICCVYSAR
jgi:hypothetical protein